MGDVLSYVLAGIFIMIALAGFLFVDRKQGFAVTVIAAGCAVVGIYAPSIGIFVQGFVLVGLLGFLYR